MVSAETPTSRRGKSAGTPASETPQGAELLDDLLKELDEEVPPATEGSPTASPGAQEDVPSRSPPQPPPPDDLGSGEVQEALRGAELARAEANSLKNALERQQGVELELRHELADLRAEMSRMRGQLEEANARFLPAAPVAFLDPGGKAVARKAFFALGKGESLDTYLTDLLRAWRESGLPLIPRWDLDGFSLVLEGDPDRRSIRVLASGIYLIQLDPKELEALGTLPTLVRRRGELGDPKTSG